MWNVVTVERFDDWLLGLDKDEQVSVLAGVLKLQEFGPQLGRPDVDSISRGKKVLNMKEL